MSHIRIRGYSHEGDGIGHGEDGDQTCFVPGALKGELVEAREIGSKGRVVRCGLDRVIEPSPNRQTPECAFFYACGGCALQHARYAHQLEIKADILSRALRVLGGFREAVIQPVTGMNRIWGYRNKGIFAVGEKAGRVHIGFVGKGSRTIQGQGCPGLISKRAGAALDTLTGQIECHRDWIRAYGLHHVMLRESFTTGQMILVLFLSKANAGLDAMSRGLFKDLTQAAPEMTGIGAAVAKVCRGSLTEDIEGDIHGISGSLVIQERLGELTFRVSPQAFFQVNTEGTRVLYGIAADLLGLTGTETIVDLYCGTGAVGLSLCHGAQQLVGIENVAEAVEDADENARINGIRNARFLTGRAEDCLPALAAGGLKADVVILDPPRKGCGPEVLAALIHTAPRRILYISCEPSTLARDLKILCAKGYGIQAIRPLDLFPQTPHVETVVLLIRAG
jgi:23S rRNA (uracil1939-C5)-methyltransferase